MFGLKISFQSSDPLQKMLVDVPMNILTQAARVAGREAAEYIKGTALIDAPWDEGTLANSHRVWELRRINKFDKADGILAKFSVAVPRRDFDDYYYAVPIEFGWDDAPDGYPWLRNALFSSEAEVYRIYRRLFAQEIKDYRHHIIPARQT